MLQGYVDLPPRGLKGQRRFAQGPPLFFEGRGWQTPINKAAVPNTYTTELLGENGKYLSKAEGEAALAKGKGCRPKPTAPVCLGLSCQRGTTF